MKKSIQNLFLGVAVVFFASCGSTSQTAFQKRKYYDFKRGDIEVALKPPVTKESRSPELQNSSPVSVKEDVIGSARKISNSPIITLAISNKKMKRALIKRVNNSFLSEEVNTTVIEKVEAEKINVINSHNNLQSISSEADLILLVIISIFLPPLAVYLKEGSITTNFWIDLLLTLLFWVPGIIFALLVVGNII